MANWAVVIGIDRYDEPRDRLSGAVRDADAMCQWLIDPAGGAVPPENIALHLEPDRHQPTSPVKFAPAKLANIILGIEKLLERSNNSGDRFFFYFAGHGISGSLNSSFPTTILAADFQPLLPNNSLTLISLYELFQCTRFKEQFFFIDACRNAAFDRPKLFGQYPNVRTPVPPISPQFVMYSTQPGVAAVEVTLPGDESGVFTGALMAGLKGKGAAKRWDPATGDYVVRWRSLFDHVRDTIVAMKLDVSTGPRPFIQEPRKFGEDGGQDPELGRFSAAQFAAETLKIDVAPAYVAAGATAQYGEMGPGVTICPAPFPATVSLAPREYWIDASAPGHRRKGQLRIVNLYTQSDVLVELEPAPPAAPPIVVSAPAPAAEAAPGGGAPKSAAPVSRGPAAGPQPITLSVSCQDTLVQIEIASQSGQLLATGRTMVSIAVQPGLYRGRVVSPEGVAQEELIPIREGDRRVERTLSATAEHSPAMNWVIGCGGYSVDSNGSFSPSETIGTAENLKLSTMLALVAGAKVEEYGAGNKLRQIPLPGFHELSGGSSCGIQVVLGDELMEPGLWPTATLSFWPIDQAQFQAEQHYFIGAEVRTAVLTPPPGSYWLKVDLDFQSSLVLPVVVTDNRLTLVVVTRERDQSIEMHQYQLASHPDPTKIHERTRDPFFNRSQFAALRRIELMQRAAAHGRVSPLRPDLELLLWDKWQDPLAGCLGGYLYLRMGAARELGVATQNLTNYFGDIPDSWVLHGEFLRATNKSDDAKAAFYKALEAGLPLYRDGLELLNSAVERYSLLHPRIEVVRDALQMVPKGSLWSAGSVELANINLVRNDLVLTTV